MLTSTLAALRPQRLIREHPRALLIIALLLNALIIGGLFARQAFQGAAPTAVLPGQTLALDIAGTAAKAQGVTATSGAYVPGTGIILYSRISQADRGVVRAWTVNELVPFADRLLKQPDKETLIWIIDYGTNQEVIQAPIRRAVDPAQHKYLGAAPGLITLPVIQPTIVAAVAPLPADAAPQATTAPADAVQPTAAAAAAPTVAPQATKAPGDAPQPTSAIALVAPPAGGVYAAPAQVTVVSNRPFDATATGWASLSGNWGVKDGTYIQNDLNGFDFISVLNVPPLSHFSLSARIKLIDGLMGGGFIYNMPDPTKRAGAQIVDFSQKGSVLRFGRYNEAGNYTYIRAVNVKPAVMDGQWHTLQLVTHAVTTTVNLDGKQVGKITNTSLGGYVGLTTSQAKVAFDSVQLIGLPEGAAAPTDLPGVPTAAPATTPLIPTVAATTAITPSAEIKEDFSSGRANGWQVLAGTWQVQDGTYMQSVTNGSDFGSISGFQSDAYTMTVQTRYIAGDMGAGIYFNLAKRDSKTSSQMLRYTSGGNFVFVGSAPTPDGGDGKWHTFTLTVQNGVAAIDLDGKNLIKDLPLVYKSGYVGLLASSSNVAFDNIAIIPLKPLEKGGKP
ncbi:MAG: hypothetical protein SH847_19170 [Roseiflexaceae bacterium]|nr:hypothetical protein [Roseiflexaceae bacterium]